MPIGQPGRERSATIIANTITVTVFLFARRVVGFAEQCEASMNNNHTTHSYRDRVKIPRIKHSNNERTTGDGMTIAGMFAFIILISWAIIVFGPSVFAVTVAALAIP